MYQKLVPVLLVNGCLCLGWLVFLLVTTHTPAGWQHVDVVAGPGSEFLVTDDRYLMRGGNGRWNVITPGVRTATHLILGSAGLASVACGIALLRSRTATQTPNQPRHPSG
jgi:hypothetical protein